MLTWQKGSATQCLISQKHGIQQVDKLILTLPLPAEKARDRAREEIRAKISAPLDPAAVSAGGRSRPVVGTDLLVKVFWRWACAAKGWPPLLLYPSGV